MSNVVLLPGSVSVRFALDPVYNNLASLYMLNFADDHAEVDEWVKQAAANLSDEQMRTQWVLLELLYSAYEPDENWADFPSFLDSLAGRDPFLMRNRFLRHMFPGAGKEYARQDQFVDLETFIARIDRSEFDREFDHDLFAQAHALLSDPPSMRDAIVAHLTTMWREILSAEWERNEPFLREIVDAFQRRVDAYAGQTAYESIRSVTGRDAHGNWQEMLASAKTIVFIPSPHVGPYLMHYAYPPVVRMLFGARHLQGAASGSVEPFPERSDEPDQVDLLVQLRTLADETRLRILDLLLNEGELYAQEIIARLGLTKSSASRHLSQLSAAGYLVERQGKGKAKCYALHPERFRDTLRFLERYAGARALGSPA